MRYRDGKPLLDDADDGSLTPDRCPLPTCCNRCGSVDVRWRQQGGRWVLFSSTPGRQHACPINASSYGAVPEDD